MVRVFGSYKCCLVPGCPNTTASAPGKLFAAAPELTWTARQKRKLDEEPNSEGYVCEDHFNMEDRFFEDLAKLALMTPLDPGRVPQLTEPSVVDWTADEDDWIPANKQMPTLKRVYPPHAEKRHQRPNDVMEAALSLCLLSQQEVTSKAPQQPSKEDKAVQCKPQKCSKSVQCDMPKRPRMADPCVGEDPEGAAPISD